MQKRRFRKYDGLKYGWFKDAKKFIILLVLVFLIFQLVIGVSSVKGDSMEPTLYNGEAVLYLRINPEYHRGDVVSVRIPSGEYYVKRVIAVGGDTIELKDGGVYVNGSLLQEPYIQGETLEQEGRVEYPLTLEEGQIFVMGDNREVSTDSRSFGVVGKRQIKGKLLFYVGGLSRRGIVS
ncbi:MAG: signal peptidase I [Lachnospiraceae bacterium]|jgi:signal peptidase I|nr:signal peptidase I [Lachnospiraceae bacterium]MCI8996683.1 signal peptidase I [Lachnospiraceae bacterium]MCI9135176.1 signal peptidase I [Lachnospiraceae bacterium]